MTARPQQSWQLILADLALILFLLTLSALAQEEASNQANAEGGKQGANRPPAPHFAAASSVYQAGNSDVTLSEWLARQAADSRATVTVQAFHTDSDEQRIWEEAQRLAQEAEQGRFAVRVVLTRASDSAIFASLAYDVPAADTAEQTAAP